MAARGARRIILAAVAGLMGSAQPGPAAPATPAPAIQPGTQPDAAQLFGQLPFVEQVAMSPKGDAMAGIFGVRGERRICAMPLFTSNKPTCVGVADGMEPFSVRWVNDTNFVVGVSAITNIRSPFISGPENIYVNRLVAMNVVTGKFTKILPDLGGQNGSNVIWTATDGSPMIELAAQGSIFTDGGSPATGSHMVTDVGFWPTVYRVNVETGRATVVQHYLGEIADWSTDGTGKVRAGVGYDDESRTARLRYRGPQGGEYHTVDSADERKRESILAPLLFLPGGNHAIALHDDKDGRSSLYEVDMTTGKDVSTFYAADGGREVTEAWTDDAGTEVVGARLNGPGRQVHYFDTGLAAVQAQFENAVKAPQQVHIVSTSRDRTRMLVQIDRPDTPGALYYYDTADGRLRRIAYMNELLSMADNSPVSLVHYQARDGLGIDAVLTLPSARNLGGRAAKELPIVVLPHGGPWAHDEAEYDYWPQYIAAQGYAVIQPNFRGSDGYGHAFERKGEGQMGLAMQDDVSDALAWAVKQGIADPKRACIVGASYGGYAAMWGIAKDPDLYRCAISIAGVANVRREVSDFGDYLYGKTYTDEWKRMTPDFAAVSPINFVAKIKAPLLLIHGQKDLTVDPVQSKKMLAAMRAAGKTVEYLPIPLADHHFQRQADRVTLLNAIGAFLAKCNPADPPAAH